MADKAVAVVSKPQLRGLLHSQIKKNLIVASGLSIVAFFAIKFAINDPRKKKYAEFYRTYDAEKDFEIMRQKGLFQSC